MDRDKFSKEIADKIVQEILVDNEYYLTGMDKTYAAIVLYSAAYRGCRATLRKLLEESYGRIYEE